MTVFLYKLLILRTDRVNCKSILETSLANDVDMNS